MNKLCTLLLLCLFIFSAQNLKADDDNTFVQDESSGNVFDKSSCQQTKTEGVMEALFELGMGKYKAAQAACCAATVERACGEKFEDISSESVRETKFANCIARANRSSNSVCADSACKAWGSNCAELKPKEVYEALKKHSKD